ncbi:hypothetical protein [Longimicrobium sp.]|uniref:hypothetical protein n=1 Tax=Longimicrobium sp. TaxID=2029185 RepID=UPI002D7F2D47|nr:hypothetical protein [Longimicrobium sp.]
MTTMPATTFDRMPDDARLFVFAAPRPLNDGEAAALLQRVDGFLERWAAHGAPVLGARDFRDGRFLLVAADERATGVSGCSIDSLQHALADAEGVLGTDLRRGASLVYWRDASGEVKSAERGEFRRLAQAGEVADDTVVFDNTVTDVGAIRAGRWETRLRDAWHARAFPIGAAAAG